MAKRGAISELNDRNWDQEEEPEEAGIFVHASDDVLEQRLIKKAKRRAVEDNVDSKPKAFTGFSGLIGTKALSSNEASFGFRKLSGDPLPKAKPSIFTGSSSVNGSEDQKSKNTGERESSTYLNSLKSLNESVLAWIKQHVENNPYILLTPIFRDYEKYLETITVEKYSQVSPSPASEGSSTSSISVDSAAGISVTDSVLTTASSKVDDCSGKQAEVSKAKPFSFGKIPTTTMSLNFGGSSAGSTGSTAKFISAPSLPAPGFFSLSQNNSSSSSFGKPTLPSSGTTNWSQGGFKFAFAKTNSQQPTSSQQPTTSEDTQEAEDEEYKPPKPEVKEIVEEDALYTKRCKLYYKKDEQWVDRGVGNLHLKPVPESENKTQILVRADTNLGNVILNIMLSSSMPVSRQGKNNVFMVCVPNPPITSSEGESVPTPMLIRVKNEEDADELFQKIDERKKLL